MRYRVVCLCLLVVLPMLNVMPAAPVPRPKPRKVHPVYALVYVGLGKNHKENPKRIANETEKIKWTIQPLADRTIKALAVVKKQHLESLAWFQAKLRIESLENTAILRVSLADGTAEEQAILVNAVVDLYLKKVEGERETLRQRLVIRKGWLRRAVESGERTDKLEAILQEVEEALANLPRLLERATVVKD